MGKWHRQLEACAIGTDAERSGSLAVCASKFNAWARQTALETARQDSLAARSSDYLIPIPRHVEIRQVCLFLCYEKIRRESQRVTDDEDDEPELVVHARKRRRF